MEERTCSSCNGGLMKHETGDIQREIKVSFVKVSIEEYLPKILKGYNQYTIYICQNCGRLELFLTKVKTMVSDKKRKKTIDRTR